MGDPRPEKVAVVEEVRERLGSASAAVLTEYRGLSVADLAELRRSLFAAGGEYKVFKNTLVRRAVSGGPHEGISQWLEGPTAIAFVSGEITAVAKALRDYSRGNPNLVLKGGILGDGLLSASDIAALADLPSRDVMLARLAGLFAAPLQQFAGLLQALPRNLAYGLSALLDQRRSGNVDVDSSKSDAGGGAEVHAEQGVDGDEVAAAGEASAEAGEASAEAGEASAEAGADDAAGSATGD